MDLAMLWRRGATLPWLLIDRLRESARMSYYRRIAQIGAHTRIENDGKIDVYKRQDMSIASFGQLEVRPSTNDSPPASRPAPVFAGLDDRAPSYVPKRRRFDLRRASFDVRRDGLSRCNGSVQADFDARAAILPRPGDNPVRRRISGFATVPCDTARR